jgi:SAM-dependent methyltransferase
MPLVASDRMRRFCDERAAENALYNVDNRPDYNSPDEQQFWDRGEQDLDHILSLLEVRVEPEDRVVEIGCGVGGLTRPLAVRARDVRALDVSERMLELAREHNPATEDVTWVLGAGDSLAGIESESATACVSQGALIGRAPRGQTHPNWLGSHVELDDLRAVADDGRMDVKRVVGEDTQLCMVLTRKRTAA